MKTRDPDHPGAQGLSPIKPGTLCLTVNGRLSLHESVLGKAVTAVRSAGMCTNCAEEGYELDAPWLAAFSGPTWAHRSNLQPILPPGIDDQVERAIGNPQLEVV